MGILDSIKKIFSGNSQPDNDPVRTQRQPPPNESKPAAAAEPSPGQDAAKPAGGSDDEEFVDLFDDTQH